MRFLVPRLRRPLYALVVAGLVVAVAAATVSASRGGRAASASGNWATFGYSVDQTRHVPFTQIKPSNISQLGRIFTVDMHKIDRTIPFGEESTPLAIDGTLYVTTPFDHVFAINGVTGKVKWHFKPSAIGPFKNFGLNTNRGVAYGAGKLYLLTLDMRIISINAQSGKLVKQVYIYNSIKQARPEFGYYETMAPIFYKNRLLVGSSGADNGVRGFLMAYTPNLKPAWPSPHWNVPPEGQDWRRFGRFHGGGAVWMSPAIDTQTDTVYFSSSNPSPDFFAALRPGTNPKVNSLIAVDLKTGKERWWRQQLAKDEWDYDTAQPPVVYDAKVKGKTRRIVSVATKEGVWFAYDAKTGEPIYQRVKVIDRIEHPPLKRGKPVTIYPSALGGVNYAPASYDPKLNYAYEASVESATVLIQAKSAKQVDKARVRGDVDTGAINGFGTTPKGRHDYGGVTAIDLSTGKVAWKKKTPEPERGGVTTTATGIAFVGGGDGVFRAFDSKTGKLLWHFQTGAQIASAPAIYTVGGKEYVAIPIGGTFTSSFGGIATKLMVFGLGGSKKQFKQPRLKPAGGSAPTRQAGVQFLTFGDAPHSFNLLLQAASGPAGGGLNFNGFNRGGMRVNVPAGSAIEVTYKNLAIQSPHSAIVTSTAGIKKLRGQKPAFPGSASPRPEAGITSGTQYFSFVASKAGQYAIVCGIAGHSIGGQWDYFNVTKKGSKPTIKLGNKTYVVTKAGAKLIH